MTDGVPDWADQELSARLPSLRARGENQDLEYKAQFPENVRELTKEIAAFATSNEGHILVGVADNGDLVGLDGVSSPLERDALVQRVQGVCRGTVKPAITPSIRFAVEDGKTVMVIKVPRGPEPLYYSFNVPYIRHVAESRPAEPHEVVELIRARATANATPNATSQLLQGVADIIFGVLPLAEEIDERMVNPWFDSWQWDFRHAAERLRTIASDDIALEHGIAGDLSMLATALDEAGHAETFIGAGSDIETTVREATAKAYDVKERWIDPVRLDSSIKVVRETLSSLSRQVQDLGARAESMIDRGRLQDVQSKASELGRSLLRMSYFKLDGLHAGLSCAIRPIGRKLHLVETMPIYADGGLSAKAMVEAITTSGSELAQVEKAVRSSG